MALIHQTDDIHISHTVSKFRIKFYGKTKVIADPDNKIEIKVDLWTVVGTGNYRSYQSKSVTSKVLYSCVFDPDTKTLTKDGEAVKMSNAAAVLDTIESEVKEALTSKKFGNKTDFFYEEDLIGGI